MSWVKLIRLSFQAVNISLGMDRCRDIEYILCTGNPRGASYLTNFTAVIHQRLRILEIAVTYHKPFLVQSEYAIGQTQRGLLQYWPQLYTPESFYFGTGSRCLDTDLTLSDVSRHFCESLCSGACVSGHFRSVFPVFYGRFFPI